jgi:hypothetical protein
MEKLKALKDYKRKRFYQENGRTIQDHELSKWLDDMKVKVKSLAK